MPRAIHKGDNQRLFTWTWTSEKGGEVLDWKKDVERLHFDEGKSITEITGLLAKKSLLPDGVTVARRYGDIYGDIQGEKYRLRQIIKKVRWSINRGTIIREVYCERRHDDTGFHPQSMARNHRREVVLQE